MTVADWARRATTALADAGWQPEGARRDIAVLARHLLGWDTATWLTHQRDDVPPHVVLALDALIIRRSTGEPVAYLTGEREFYGRTFVVSPAVLIPRPETELLVERALAAIDARARAQANVTVVDIGTGSGCIAVTLAAERPSVRIVATDTSGEALAAAAANAARLGVDGRIRFVHAALTGGTEAADVIVSNPPYVPARDRDSLIRDVRDFEPHTALFGGDDGLEVIGALVPEATSVLAHGGTLLLEIGADQASAVGDLLSAAGLTAVRTWPDLAGIPRVAEATKRDGSV